MTARCALVTLLVAATASAGPITPRTDLGALARAGANGFLLTTVAADAAYSFGRATLVDGVAGTYELALAWRRIDADAGSIEIWLPDNSVVLLNEEQIGYWHDNASFPGFAPLPGFRTQATTRIAIAQSRDAVEVRIDGVPVARWGHAPPPAPGALAVALKAPPRRRARLWFAEVAFAHGQ